jgi:hypothetical protein
LSLVINKYQHGGTKTPKEIWRVSTFCVKFGAN